MMKLGYLAVVAVAAAGLGWYLQRRRNTDTIATPPIDY